MNILPKNMYLKIFERLQLKENDSIYIHHPITNDVVVVNIQEKQYNKLLVSIPEDSDYYGQPNFYIKKTQVIGKV